MDSPLDRALETLGTEMTCEDIASLADASACDMVHSCEGGELIAYSERTGRRKILVFSKPLGDCGRQLVSVAVVRRNKVYGLRSLESVTIKERTPLRLAASCLAERDGVCLIQRKAGQVLVMTRSDLNKAPFRMYCFCLITYLEMFLFDAIWKLMGRDWQNQLSTDELKRSRDGARRNEKTEDPRIVLSYASLLDKLKVFRKWYQGRMGTWPGSEQTDMLIRDLRNDLAHGDAIVKDFDSMFGVAKVVEELPHRIRHVYEQGTYAIRKLERP